MIKEIKLGEVRALYYEPDNLKSDAKLPCLIMYNGIGENDNDGDIDLVYKHGPFKYLKDGGWKPDNFIFINIFPKVDFPNPIDVDIALDAIMQLEWVDKRRLNGIGISAGGETWMRYVLEFQGGAEQLRSLIVMSIPRRACDIYNHNPEMADRIKALPIHFFHGTDDVAPCAIGPVRNLFKELKQVGNTAVEMTEMQGVGHGGWSTICSPTNKVAKERTESIYDWFMRFNKEEVVEPEKPPENPMPTEPKLVHKLVLNIYDDGSYTMVDQISQAKGRAKGIVALEESIKRGMAKQPEVPQAEGLVGLQKLFSLENVENPAHDKPVSKAALKAIKDIDLSDAIDVLRTTLAEDRSEGYSYYYTWQANIAMAFYDEYQRQAAEREYVDLGKLDIHTIANKAARNFLNQLIDYPPKQSHTPQPMPNARQQTNDL